MAGSPTDQPPISIEEFGRRHAHLHARLEAEGQSPELERQLAVLWGSAGLQVALGPTSAFVNVDDAERLWPTDFDFRAYDALFASLSNLEPVFTNDRWGSPTLSSSTSTIEGHRCPAIRVRWTRSHDFVFEYREHPENVSQLLDGMLAIVCLLFGVRWRRWRVEVVEIAADSSLSDWNA